MRKINIATQFSRYPAGRFCTDGPNSGERFREEFLTPVLESGESTEVILDGARGYGSSFLEEAFGGLVRKGYSTDRIKQCFKLISNDDSSLEAEVYGYIDEARAGV
ncbi:MAG: DUF4325 domain-containing protein [Methylococcaceae bacterium]|nr:MAG: DUF4325 domain-containing protein [Methylococcaceae bacterium]